jgi:hypothetical protein
VPPAIPVRVCIESRWNGERLLLEDHS